MENTENNSPKAKELIADYEKKGKLNNPKAVKNDLAYLAEKPIKNVTKELATYFNSSEKEIKNDASKIGKAETKEREIPGKEAQVLNNDKNQNGIKDNREHDRNNNSIPDKKERDLNQNGIDDKLERIKNLKPGDSIKFSSDKEEYRVNNIRPDTDPKIYLQGKENGKEIQFRASQLNPNLKSEDITINGHNKQERDDFTKIDTTPVLSKKEVNLRLDAMFEPGKHKAEEIPFKDFKTYLGLDEKQVLDKGKPFLEPLLNGGRTEMENHKITSANDMEVKGRLSVRDNKLNIHPLQPELKEGEKLNIKGYQPIDLTKKEIAQINLGNAITKSALNRENGKKEVLFLQKDQQNNEVLGLPQNKLRSPDSVGKKLLSIEQKEQISKGKELTIKDPEKGNTTVKIDLTSNKGFSVYNERGMKDNKSIEFHKRDFGNKEDRSFSKKEEKGLSRERVATNERSFKPDNQRSRGSNSRSR